MTEGLLNTTFVFSDMVMMFGLGQGNLLYLLTLILITTYKPFLVTGYNNFQESHHCQNFVYNTG